MRTEVTAHAGRIPFRDKLLLPSEAGRLQIQSAPRARVWLDGVSVSGWTPVREVQLTAGMHRIRLVTEAGLTRDYEVKVGVGRTTSLSVELK